VQKKVASVSIFVLHNFFIESILTVQHYSTHLDKNTQIYNLYNTLPPEIHVYGFKKQNLLKGLHTNSAFIMAPGSTEQITSA